MLLFPLRLQKRRPEVSVTGIIFPDLGSFVDVHFVKFDSVLKGVDEAIKGVELARRVTQGAPNSTTTAGERYGHGEGLIIQRFYAFIRLFSANLASTRQWV